MTPAPVFGPVPGLIVQARRLGRARGIKVVAVVEREDPKVPGKYVRAYVIYRHRSRVMRRRDPAEILRWVRQEITPAEAAHATAAR